MMESEVVTNLKITQSPQTANTNAQNTFLIFVEMILGILHLQPASQVLNRGKHVGQRVRQTNSANFGHMMLCQQLTEIFVLLENI